ncbi:hypothetical protein, partial [Pseudomonas syringae]|uniref:hypothetical protein n=1 Tax=Pseudomonas syringae TaxID=317 RepID=UPI001110464E
DLVAMQTIDQSIFEFFQEAVGKRCKLEPKGFEFLVCKRGKGWLLYAPCCGELAEWPKALPC